MSADILFDLIKEFSSKGNITASEMELLRAQAKQLDLSEDELKGLINEVINEEKIHQEKTKKEKEAKRKKIEETEQLKKKQEEETKKRNEIFKKKSKKATIVIAILGVLITVIIFSYKYFKQENLWNEVKQQNIYSSYQNYLNQYPEGRHNPEAHQLQEEAAWQEAQNENIVQSYDKYITTYPNGKYVTQALAKKEDAFWEVVKSKNTMELYSSYLYGYPNGKYKNLIWDLVSPLIIEPKNLGASNFFKLYQVLQQLNLPIDITVSDRYQFATGLKYYLDGDKLRAQTIFETIVSKNPNSSEGKLSVKILAPPLERKIAFNSQSFNFKGTWSYFNGEGGIIIQLIAVDINNSTITISFSMRVNGNNKDCLIYAQKNISEEFGSHCETLYLLDDNGKKVYTTSGFIGGKSEEYNSCTNKICFNPGEELILSAKFPMVSTSATSIKFVSPNPDNAGHQSEWYWDNIKIKDGPFD